MGMLPKVCLFANLPKNPEIDEKRLTHVEAVINSMTAKERANSNLLDGKRRKRISKTNLSQVHAKQKQKQKQKQNKTN